MDLEEQGRIRQLVEAGERDRMVVLLGTPDASSTLMVARRSASRRMLGISARTR